MQKKSIAWGILGTSPISTTMAHAINESDSGHVNAVASRSLSRAEHFANEFSIPRFYDDYEALLIDPAIDVVYLGLPNHLHHQWIIKAARANKHILCEKPLVINRQEALDVITEVRRARVLCMEALMYRCHPFIRKIKDIVDDGAIGEVRLYNAVYTADIAKIANQVSGGSILNLGCYPISLIRFLAQKEPREIIGRGRRDARNRADRQASVILQFEEASMAIVSTADDMPISFRFDVYGSAGSITALTNPWLPPKTSQLVLTTKSEPQSMVITLNSEKSLYVYQIDILNNDILEGNLSCGEISLEESLNNIITLQTWLGQVC